jgi:integrase
MPIKVKIIKPKRGNLVLRWTSPENGRVCETSARTLDRREAERKAGQLQADLDHGRHVKPSHLLWSDFRNRYEHEKMTTFARGKNGPGQSALNHFQRVINPKYLANATATTISHFQAQLRGAGMKDTTIATHLRHLRAALSWGHAMGLLPLMPRVEQPKHAKGQRLMRGRPLAAEEFERMLDAVPKVRPNDPKQWTRLLTGLWLSGLRLGEALELSWELDGRLFVDLAGKHPQLRIWAEAEKGRRDRKLPLTPDFAEWLLQTPQPQRTGIVFPIEAAHHEQMHDKYISHTICAIGKNAAIIVNKEAGKYASAHDLRRSFGTRWAKRVMPAVLQKLMRHSAIETTLRYYADIDADELAADLWKQYAPVAIHLADDQPTFQPLGGTLGGTPTDERHPPTNRNERNPL